MAGETYLFEPAHTPCEGLLLVPDALIDIGEQGETTLVIANAGTQTVQLEQGALMGKLRECQVPFRNPLSSVLESKIMPDVSRLERLPFSLCQHVSQLMEDMLA